MDSTPQQCASDLLETIPRVMDAIRMRMRTHREGDLSVPAFRTLMFLGHHPEVSLSEVAEFIGIALPSMSKLVDALVTRQMVHRATDARDRRRITLAITPAGRAVVERAHQKAQACLAEALARRTDEERAMVVAGLRALRVAFGRQDKTDEKTLEAKAALP